MATEVSKTEDKLSEAEFQQIDKEIASYRIKEGSDKQKVYKELYGVDLTGRLFPDGELQWLEYRGAIKMNKDKRYGPAVVFNKDGTEKYTELCKKLSQYLWLKSVKDKSKHKAYDFELLKKPVVEVVEDEVKPEDIPF